jgi:hypothetical protein
MLAVYPAHDFFFLKEHRIKLYNLPRVTLHLWSLVNNFFAVNWHCEWHFRVRRSAGALPGIELMLRFDYHGMHAWSMSFSCRVPSYGAGSHRICARIQHPSGITPIMAERRQ